MGYALMDIGGTNLRYAFVDKAGELDQEHCFTVPFPHSDTPEQELNHICNIIGSHKLKLDGVGISIAAPFQRNTGRIVSWPNHHKWDGFPLRQYLTERFQVPVLLEDDANCGAVAEYGSVRTQISSMAYVTIGTGIGCGLIVNGSLFTGESGAAGEIGHLYVGGNHICSCGQRGCLQSEAAGPAIERSFFIQTGKRLGCRQILSLARRKNIDALYCMTEIGRRLAYVLFNLSMCFDLSVFVLGGGVGTELSFLYCFLEEEANRRLETFSRKVSVLPTKWGVYSGVCGVLSLLRRT